MIGSSAFREQCVEEGFDCTARNIPILKKMNELGYVTFDSQSGLEKKVGENTLIQRSYIHGFMQKKTAAKFIRKMNLETGMLCMLIPHASQIEHTDPRMDLPLTISLKKDKKEPEVVTHMSSAVPNVTHKTFLRQAGLDRVDEELDHIFCMDLKWKRHADSKDGLFSAVYQSLKKSN